MAFLTLATGCENRQSNQQVAEYKASLELPSSSISYREAMKTIVAENILGMLELVARDGGPSKKANGYGGMAEPFNRTLDTAVRVENLMRRADWAGFKGREIDPSGFDALVRRSLDQADDLARAAADRNSDSTRRAAKQLLSSCQGCHESYR